MAPHSSTLAWKIPWTEEPGRLQSMGSLRVGHDRVTSLSLFTFIHWRRKWQPTPVFLPGESQGRGSLVGCRLWDHTESDTTEVTQQQQQQPLKQTCPQMHRLFIQSFHFLLTYKHIYDNNNEILYICLRISIQKLCVLTYLTSQNAKQVLVPVADSEVAAAVIVTMTPVKMAINYLLVSELREVIRMQS